MPGLFLAILLYNYNNLNISVFKYYYTKNYDIVLLLYIC